MSDWVDLANGTAAAVVGVAGIVGTFFGGRSASREGRQHARLESVYEGLAEFLVQFGSLTNSLDNGTHRGLSQDQHDQLVEKFQALVAKLQLWAGDSVIDHVGSLIATVNALTGPLQSPAGADGVDESVRELIRQFDEQAGGLVNAMRRDLALPARRK